MATGLHGSSTSPLQTCSPITAGTPRSCFASLSLCPGGCLPDQHPLQSTRLAGCQIAWVTSSTWSGKHAQELQLLHLLVHSGTYAN